MFSFDSELEQLSAQNHAYQVEHAQTLARIEINKQKYVDAKAKLQELGYSSIEEANAKILELSREIQQDLEKIAEGLL